PLGRALAQTRQVPCIDLDDFIEQGQGLSVSEIFRRHGEQHFRDLEREALERVAAVSPGAIVACGRGTPCFGDNMDRLNSSGLTVYLQAPHSSLLRRLSEGKATRPLIADLDDSQLSEFITSQLALRDPYYSRAQLSFDSSRLEDSAQIHDSVEAFLSLIARET
ncbi:MAG: shikimate kinase, partial [Duncaniella sp.]|nr:shikimate kinase [Duncaniella sp.]